MNRSGTQSVQDARDDAERRYEVLRWDRRLDTPRQLTVPKACRQSIEVYGIMREMYSLKLRNASGYCLFAVAKLYTE